MLLFSSSDGLGNSLEADSRFVVTFLLVAIVNICVIVLDVMMVVLCEITKLDKMSILFTVLAEISVRFEVVSPVQVGFCRVP